MLMLHFSDAQPLGISFYEFFHITAVLTAFVVAGIAAVKSKFGFREFAVIASFGVLTLLMGSKLLRFDSNQWNYLFTQFQFPEEHGKSTIGAILGLILGLCVAARLVGKNESILNLFALSIPLALAVQGFACLSAGCCHGELTNLPWGVTYGQGTFPFIEQQRLGLIPEDGLTSLPVHPSQLYTVIASLCIALIVWKSRFLFRSRAGSFLLSIILFMAYRLAEGISPYSLTSGTWMGMNSTLWKGVILLLFSSLLIYDEWKARQNKPSFKINHASSSYHHLILFILALITVAISLQLGNWFSPDDKILIVLLIFPLCGFIILEKVISVVIQINYIRTSMIACLALVLMSQKADVPSDTPKSYTSFNVTSTFGEYDMDHLFNKVPGTDICGDPYISGDEVGYHHSYVAGGLGISRKKYYTAWQSTTLSLNVFAGQEKQTPIYNPHQDVVPPKFEVSLWNINPQFQFDTRGFGMGLGLAVGNTAYDKESALDNLDDYDPKTEGRKFLIQSRLRFFSERYFFIEGLTGYDAGGTGEFNWSAVAGSRFNSDKYMLKAGIVGTIHSPASFTIKGEMRLAPQFYLSPQFNIYTKNDTYSDYDGGGYRAAIGLEYRLFDKEK